jgi:hypothetical protein
MLQFDQDYAVSVNLDGMIDAADMQFPTLSGRELSLLAGMLGWKLVKTKVQTFPLSEDLDLREEEHTFLTPDGKTVYASFEDAV